MEVEVDMKDLSKMERKTEKDDYITKMEVFMMALGKTIRWMDLENFTTQLDKLLIKATG